MAERTFISFDWAIKKVLRHKENFTVLEGFLSELLGFDIKIQNLLESEGNKQHESDKFDRVDILVKSEKGELLLIEVQYDDEADYFHRMVYENMEPEDQAAYKRHIENRRIEMGVVGTAIDKAKREQSIEFAKESLKEGASIDFVTKVTKLERAEVEKLAQGEDIDKEEDE